MKKLFRPLLTDKRAQYLISVLLIIFLTGSCSYFEKKKGPDEDKGKVIAEVHGEYLYQQDIEGISMEGDNQKDTSLTQKHFINNWIKEELIFRKALANLTEEEKNMEEELELYYKSLIKYKYIEKIVNQRLNRKVSNEEIAEYYQQNIDAFKLKRCIIRLIFMHIPVSSPELGKVKKWYISSKVSDLDLLHQYCIIHASKYNLDDSRWFYADEIMSEIPFDIKLCKLSENERSFELKDSNFVYFFNISEIKDEGNTSPLEFENERIRHIILHKRRVELIKKVEESIFNEGIRKSYFEIYD